MESTGQNHGVVYWITGVPGSGKSTIGFALVTELRKRGTPVLFLDGDVLRKILGDTDYSEKGRRRLARKYSELCKTHSSQGINVVCATVSLFHEVHEWNRRNIPHYIEIFVRATEQTLQKRDQKGLYSTVDTHDVVGRGIPVELPLSPHLTLDNDGETRATDQVSKILQFLQKESKNAV